MARIKGGMNAKKEDIRDGKNQRRIKRKKET